MAKYCEVCKKKIGVFERTHKFSQFNLLCDECYEKEKNELEEYNKIESEKIRIKWEEERKKKLKEQKIKNEKFKLEFKLYFYSISLL